MLDAFNVALDARGGAQGGEITLRIETGDRFVRDLKFKLDKQNSLSGVSLVQGGYVT